MVKRMRELLQYNYELFTSSNTLSKNNSMDKIYKLVTVSLLMAKYIWGEENS